MKYAFTILALLLLSSCLQQHNTLKIKGSDTEVNLSVKMAEAFGAINDSILLSISGGGSGLGIASLLNGTADIANSSRRMNAEELALFRQKAIPIDSFIFAQDAIAFIVSDKTPIDSIQTKQLAFILNGTYQNWLPISGQDLPINIYGRQSNSGTYSFVKKVLNIQFSAHAKQMNGNAQILEAIKTDASGIGYVGAGYVAKENMKGLKILTVYKENQKAVSPLDARKIASGEYVFQRPLYQYFKAQAYPQIKPFIDFEKSAKGHNLIQSSGYYPIH